MRAEEGLPKIFFTLRSHAVLSTNAISCRNEDGMSVTL